jgi:replicative DNA helicase
MAENPLAVSDRLEQSCLGGILRHPPALADIAPMLSPDDFREVRNQLVYKAALALWDAARTVDLVTVADYLHKHGHMADLDGYNYLAQLWDSTITGAQAVHHAEGVRDNALLRRLALAGADIAQFAQQPHGSAQEMLQEAEKAIFRLALAGAGQAHSLRDVIAETFDRIDARQAQPGQACGVATGLDGLDAVTAGLQPSELVILAARPSQGKTALGLTIARNVAAAGKAVFVASIEQSRVELAERLLCAEAPLDAARLRHGRMTGEDCERFTDCGKLLAEFPLWIDDGPGQSVLRIASHARRLKLRHNLALVVVDYLQLVEPDSRKDPRHEQVAGVSRRLKALARELCVPVLALAQLNREVESRGEQRPRLSDLRESGSIEADADMVILLHRPGDPSEKPALVGPLNLILAKNRNGPTGEITLSYDRARMRFSEIHAHDPFAGR